MSILKRLSITETELTKVADDNSNLYCILEGYACEIHFEKVINSTPSITHHFKPGDQNREQKGDRVVIYKDTEISIEIRNVYRSKKITKTQDVHGTTTYIGKFKGCSSHYKDIIFSDGSKLNTTYCSINSGINIYAVCIAPFTDEYKFIYCLTENLPRATNCNLTDLQKNEIITPYCNIKYPPEYPWTDDIEQILEQVYLQKTKPNLINT